MGVNDPIFPLKVRRRLAPNPITNPQFSESVRLGSGATIQVADPKATRAMLGLMDMGAVMEGAACHWGGPSAFAELMSATHGLMFERSKAAKTDWSEMFSFVNDGGHCENGLYALKANYGFAGLSLKDLRHFRSLDSKLSGHGESLLFPEGVMLSNGPLGSAFPQAQGLAMADRMAEKSNRVTIAALTDGGLMEGEAREALAALPGLAAAGKVAPFVMIISDNNTKLTGRIDEESFSMAPTFKAMADLGWDVWPLEQAHDLQACTTLIERALDRALENPHRPIAIHARTIKGYGIGKSVASKSGGHGFPLKDPAELDNFLSEIYGTQPVPKPFLDWAQDLRRQKVKVQTTQGEKVQAGVSRALIKKRREGLPVISISADLAGSTGLAEFQKAFPEAVRDIGVAESNMISVAVGASKLGYIPVVDTFAQFGVTKGALPLMMSSLSQAPIIAVFSHAGFQDAADGASHQSLSHFAMTSSIPHVRVFALATSDEAEALIGTAIEEFATETRAGRTPDSYIFFLGRENFPASYGQAPYVLGKARIVRESERPKVVIAAAGAMVEQALKAADLLGPTCTVINVSAINKPDLDTLTRHLARAGGRLLTVEDHQVVGGMGGQLIHALTEKGFSVNARTLGVRGVFGRSAYSAEDLYRAHGLDAESIAAAVRKLD